MRGPLHPQLAHLERSYLTLRNEVENREIDEITAASILRSAAVADAKGNHWWVDFKTSDESAVFFSTLSGSPSPTPPSEFRHSSPEAVPVSPQENRDPEAKMRFPEVERRLSEASVKNEKQVEAHAEGSTGKKSAPAARDISWRESALAEGTDSRMSEQHYSSRQTPFSGGFPRKLLLVPAVVIAFLLAVLLFGGSAEEQAPGVSFPSTPALAVESGEPRIEDQTPAGEVLATTTSSTVMPAMPTG